MSEPLPSLDVVWKVVNIGEEDLADIREAHSLRTGNAEEAEALGRLLRPVDAMLATGWHNTEFLNLQRHLGGHGMSKERVEELADTLREESPYAGQDLSASTFPSIFQKLGEGSIVNMAGSGEVAETRAFAAGRIAKFLGLNAIPKGVMLPNEQGQVTRVRLAWARKSAWRRNILENLQLTLEQKPSLLPDTTKFDKMNVRVTTSPRGSARRAG